MTAANWWTLVVLAVVILAGAAWSDWRDHQQRTNAARPSPDQED